jgi:hypothetical protein
MSRLTGLIFLFLLFFVGCTDKTPKGLLEIHKMQDILTDLLLAEGFTENFLLLDTSKKRDEWLAGEYSKVMAIHQISQQQFRSSLDYYKKRPDLFKEIIDSVNQRGIRHRDESYQQVGKKKRKKRLD